MFMEQSAAQTCKRYVEFWKLLRHLDAMSNGAEHWVGRPLAPSFVSTKGDVQRYILVGYSPRIRLTYRTAWCSWSPSSYTELPMTPSPDYSVASHQI
jgi:hypothetical protein